MNKKPKILIWDIETSLNIVTTFSLFPKYISHENILQDWYIICGAWKFLDEKTTHAFSGLNDPKRFDKDFTDDYEVVKKLRDVVESADIIVHHNGDKFDLKKLNARIIKHGLDPLPKHLLTVDTLKQARKHFSFTSNRLDYLGSFLKCGRKMHTAPGLWLEALNGKKKAVRDMTAYNKVDVTVLEDIYKKMLPYIDHPNMGGFFDDDRPHCTNCASEKMHKKEIRPTRAGTNYQIYRCKDCGATSKSRIKESTPAPKLR